MTSPIWTGDSAIAMAVVHDLVNITLLGTFGGAAVLLAAIGIHGLMAYAVQQRTHEIESRFELGAASTHVRNRVLWQAMRVALLGVGIGMASAFGIVRLLSTFLFGVTAWDPVTFVAVPLALSAVAAIGVWLPARRAAQGGAVRIERMT